LFGQLLLVRGEDYRRVGGHEAVRGRILENFYLAERFRRAAIPMRCRGGRGTVSMRMYPGGLRELVEGWSKAFAAGAARTSPALLAVISAWITGAIITVSALGRAVIVSDPAGAAAGGIVYGLFVLQIHSMLRRIGTFSFLTSVVYPVPLIFYLVVFVRSAVGPRVAWKGRTIPRKEAGSE
jgi:4,4'-diaponeurosporenoate glycosyltransferase